MPHIIHAALVFIVTSTIVFTIVPLSCAVVKLLGQDVKDSVVFVLILIVLAVLAWYIT